MWLSIASPLSTNVINKQSGIVIWNVDLLSACPPSLTSLMFCASTRPLVIRFPAPNQSLNSSTLKCSVKWKVPVLMQNSWLALVAMERVVQPKTLWVISFPAVSMAMSLPFAIKSSSQRDRLVENWGILCAPICSSVRELSSDSRYNLYL